MLLLAGAAASLFGQLLKSSAQGVAPELLAKGRAQLADQAFTRKMAEYKLNIEQQKLFREDIRDLVELSVGRMDIYHLVGALLLGLCITLYTKNPAMEAEESPTWAVSLFMVSNLGAAGYLVLATWFSMHASVASHTIGVRLLTQFARLSIPTRKELEEAVRVPLLSLRAAEPPAGATLEEGSRAIVDKEHHLRRFLLEQKQWLQYDAHARVCMNLGMNQVLLALSYYIISRSAGRQPTGTVASLVGLQVLAIILERLDLRPVARVKVEVAGMAILGQVSPVLVGLAAWASRARCGDVAVELSLVAAFVLHALWLMYNGLQFRLFSKDDLSMIPRRLRTVLYLDVLDIEPEEPPSPDGGETPSPAADGGETPSPPAAAGPPQRQRSLPPLLPPGATPAEELPRALARRFTCALAFLWVAAAAIHVVHLALWGPEAGRGPDELRTRPLTAGLGPELFQAAAIRCRDSLLVLSDGSSHFAVRRGADGSLGEAEALEGDADASDAALAAAAAAAPGNWSRVSVALTTAPADAGPEAVLAGWDGARIVVARARRGASGVWKVSPRFAVRSRCTGGRSRARDEDCGAGSSADYKEALALQLGPGGSTLAVLHAGGSHVDLWDLLRGRRFQRWRLEGDAPATAMCHDGRELILARQGADGMILEAATVPLALRTSAE